MKRKDKYLVITLVAVFAAVVYITFQQSIIQKSTVVFQETAGDSEELEE